MGLNLNNDISCIQMMACAILIPKALKIILLGLCGSHFMQNFKFCAVLNMLSTLFLQNIADAVA